MKQPAPIDDVLSDAAIQTAADMKKQMGDETILYSLLIIAIGNQRTDKLASILAHIGKENFEGERPVDDLGRTPFDYLVRCKNNKEVKRIVLEYCNQKQLGLYAAIHADLQRQVDCLNAPLTLEEIQTAIDIMKESGNVVPLKFFFAKSVLHADAAKMMLLIAEIPEEDFCFHFEINAKGTSPIDYLARCKDPKFIQTALIYCTEEEKQLYEQKKSNQTAATVAPKTSTTSEAPLPPSTKVSQKNFHKDAQSAHTNANRSAVPSKERESGCTLQ